MMVRFLVLFLLICWTHTIEATDSPSLIPTAYQGRIRPLEATGRLWLYDLYHRQQLLKDDLPAFHTTSQSAVDFFLTFHLMGHHQWDDAPLFWIQHASTKQLLGLNAKENRFSYNQLHQAFVEHEQTNQAVTNVLIRHHYHEAYRAPSNRSGSTRLELTSLAQGLWVATKNQALIVVQAPSTPPWQHLKPGQIITNRSDDDKAVVDELLALWQHMSAFARVNSDGAAQSNKLLTNALAVLQSRGIKPDEIAQMLETQLPLKMRLLDAGSALQVLPGKLVPGEWYSLKALTADIYDSKLRKLVPVGNFTIYPDELFFRLRQAYVAQASTETLANLLSEGYEMLEGQLIQESGGKSLFYPTHRQLVAEMWYYDLPLPIFALAAYVLAALAFSMAYSLQNRRLQSWAWASLAIAWIIHTSILVLRCYILGRPPVANMFETVVYVPWIAVIASCLMFLYYRSVLLPLAASILAVILLAVLEVTQLHSGLETVQPVLDSQYWLIIHVLMVVASYGVFLLSGVLGHGYLLLRAKRPHSRQSLDLLSRAILHSMYLGTAMLISGTILGGVWAAESWGRFWDWDPKESWAFISSCVYLVCIHAYTFNHIRALGLAIGSIVGLWAISFTWYGVNYILGTGLHSYGFGTGGVAYYYGFLASEVLFVAICYTKSRYRIQSVSDCQ